MGRPSWPPEVVATIEEMAGTVPAAVIARTLRIPLGNLQSWAARRGISLRRHPSRENRKVFGRLRQTAARQGLHLRTMDGKVQLFEPLTELVTVEEAERLLARRRPGDQRREERRRHLARTQKTAIGNTAERTKVTLPSLRFMQDDSHVEA